MCTETEVNSTDMYQNENLYSNVSDQVLIKPAWTASEDSQRRGMSVIDTGGIVLSM